MKNRNYPKTIRGKLVDVDKFKDLLNIINEKFCKKFDNDKYIVQKFELLYKIGFTDTFKDIREFTKELDIVDFRKLKALRYQISFGYEDEINFTWDRENDVFNIIIESSDTGFIETIFEDIDKYLSENNANIYLHRLWVIFPLTVIIGVYLSNLSVSILLKYFSGNINFEKLKSLAYVFSGLIIWFLVFYLYDVIKWKYYPSIVFKKSNNGLLSARLIIKDLGLIIIVLLIPIFFIILQKFNIL